MRLRSYLVLLVVAAIVPLALFATVIGRSVVERERERFIHGMQERALALMTAVDAELNGSRATLDALTVMPSLAAGDLRYFRKVAANVLASQPDWINITVSRPDGQQIINLRAPEGGALPNIAPLDESFGVAIGTGRAAIGNLTMGPVVQQWAYVIRTPVMRDGAVLYVLSAAVKPESMARILAAQQLKPDYGAVVLDGHDRFVARNWNPEKYLGQLASPSLREALARAPNGWFRGVTVEGREVYSPYVRSASTGWAVSMGVPASAIDAAATRAAWLFVAGLLSVLCLAVLLARVIAGQISRPILSLAAVAESIKSGESVRVPADVRVSELRSLSVALQRAADAATERKAVAASLEQADRAKDEFLAVLSHELRNPLAALTTSAHVLKVAPPGDAAAIQARRVIERQTKQMTRLVEDLLDVSRITVGKLSLEREVLDLRDLVRGVIATWRRSKNARIAFSEPAAPLWIHADRVRIEQILSNLLDNSLKFSPAGTPVSVALRAEQGLALMEVSDEGEGIEAEALSRVFDLFVQGKQGPDRAKSGLGLGLALVRRLTELHGGSVSAISDGLGRGARFTVRLPLAPPSAGAPTALRVAAPVGSRRILIIEDNDDAREMLHAMLELGGHHVHDARDGASGLAAAAEHAPDIVLIDIGLPDGDGYEIARRLRSQGTNDGMKLVAITGYGSNADERRAREAGFDAHLTKPVGAEQLTQTLAELR